MHQRINILREHNLTLADIQAVIATMQPLEGAAEFLQWARSQTSCIIISDTFYEFAMPLMAQLGYPTLFCHSLEIDADGMVHRLPSEPQRRQAPDRSSIAGPRLSGGSSRRFCTTIRGCSQAAEQGIFFGAPDAIAAEFPQFPVLHTYPELQAALS